MCPSAFGAVSASVRLGAQLLVSAPTLRRRARMAAMACTIDGRGSKPRPISRMRSAASTVPPASAHSALNATANSSKVSSLRSNRAQAP